MKLLDDPFWWNTDGTDEERSLLFNDDINEVGELSLSVIVLDERKCILSYLQCDTFRIGT